MTKVTELLNGCFIQAALSLLMMDQDEDKQHFNLKSIQESEKLENKKKKRRRNKKKLLEQKVMQDTFQVRSTRILETTLL